MHLVTSYKEMKEKGQKDKNNILIFLKEEKKERKKERKKEKKQRNKETKKDQAFLVCRRTKTLKIPNTDSFNAPLFGRTKIQHTVVETGAALLLLPKFPANVRGIFVKK